MRLFALAFATVLIAACCPSSRATFAAPVELQPDGSLREVLWLSGTWVTSDELTEEHWSVPRGGTMMGYSLSAVGGRRVHYEHLRIDANDGTVTYHADPVGQALTSFALRESKEGHLVFENLDHDYPKRIEYRSLGPGQLVVHLSGVEDGEAREHQIEMWRVEPPACAPDGS